ncbi:putative armadillo-like helical, exportin-1/Importin-beta, exportin-T [Helianthus annuus]|uniref:Exportin-T n=1 Tax=Helianthus annuus TaxID=4232 RepID=A0A251U1R4_HELAN|nr:exportin-T [Helianthus annuus]KAF5793437.1 putative armadillo-like helical, exportin-1/Importin-beta, exportin-T [Helianthus annuus]KAJ0528273.1 putative armadillo-like helical, exportin-1/Importin-beta, exportin-T [Helianthus annuus]KAJ0544703.1 putative armadillo-like helical, exportin-1/Importin-beta, exportin-T [Helianthus annuus]KAJ0709705.1 putative armadillo-like helical, exportin-1/Importin-beta, exportin-T [Helianthus annuus]KAJ0713577.1 putative armadillo-like helical, exportin-1/
MDDLEKAILIIFDESGTVTSVLKSQAGAFCQQIKDSPSICSICIERLCFSKLVQVQFWCLQCLHEVVRARYSGMSTEEKNFVRKSVFSMACYETVDSNANSVKVLDSPPYVRNKLAQILVTLIYYEYPEVWSSVFLDFIPNLNKGGAVIDMFCRVLNALDDELISQDYPRAPEEGVISGKIKDAMRLQCVGQIVHAWYDIVSLYKNSDSELCAFVLDTMRRYISWIEIGLIANNTFLPLLFELMLVEGLPDQLRCAASGCVLAVVSKRMDPQAKLTLLQNLQISRVFGLVAADGDSEFVSGLASLLTGYASELLDCVKNIKNGDLKRASVDLLNEVLPSVFYIMQNCEIDTTFSIVQFLSGYVATMKTPSPLTESQLYHVGQILEVIRMQIRYDPMYRDNLDVLDKVGKEEEDRMAEHRKDLLVLLRSVGRVAPDVTQIFIRNSLSSAVGSSLDVNVEEVEAALSLFYAYGESLSEEAMKTGSGILRELVPMLLSTKFPCHSNRLVALVYLDTITRYMKFVLENNQYIPLVLAAFLDDRGIHHSNVKVSRRASYLFMRVVKLLKSKLVPFIETILQSLHDTVSQFTNMDYASKELSGSEDGSHIFEAIGLLIGMEDVPLEKQSEYLSSLLTPLCQQVEILIAGSRIQNSEDSPSKVANIQQIIMAINALSKGFSERLVTASRPAIGLMFKQTLDVLLQILIIFPKVETLRSKVTAFIHRMVETLGSSVFPYLPKALEQLLAESEPKELVGFLVLLNQLICKFNTSVQDILENVYPVIGGRIFSILPRDTIPSGPGSNTEEIRELQELQRTFYTFLHVMATHDLSSVFLSPKSQGYLDSMMQLLLFTSCNHKDLVVRKACVQIFIRLIKDWCTRPEKVPGFQTFVIEAFATNCCLYSVLDKSFEFRDANTVSLFGEIVLAQKVMYEKLGNDFLINFVSKGFLAAHCPQELAEEYCQKLQGNDMKSLKSFYQSLIENLRTQQNGSLVFR